MGFCSGVWVCEVLVVGGFDAGLLVVGIVYCLWWVFCIWLLLWLFIVCWL